ncbi:54S ribosomal protein L6 mitochondrial [Lecanora helva]
MNQWSNDPVLSSLQDAAAEQGYYYDSVICPLVSLDNADPALNDISPLSTYDEDNDGAGHQCSQAFEPPSFEAPMTYAPVFSASHHGMATGSFAYHNHGTLTDVVGAIIPAPYYNNGTSTLAGSTFPPVTVDESLDPALYNTDTSALTGSTVQPVGFGTNITTPIPTISGNNALPAAINLSFDQYQFTNTPAMIIRSNSLRVPCCKPSLNLFDFLIPPRPLPQTRKTFSSTSRCRSRIGGAPLSLPAEVNLRILQPPPPRKNDIVRTEPTKTVEVEGPLGKMSLQLPPYMTIEQNPDTRKATLSILDREQRKQREMWGTTRANLSNHILGVSEGHTAILRLVGVGYRATIEPSAVSVQPTYPGQPFVSLKVGYSHPIELGVPMGMKASVPQPTRILLEGPEKEVVNQFAARIRKWRVPEPYKGKGIFVNGETVKLKAKKIK